MRFRLVPSDRRFFELFAEAAQNLADCSVYMRKLVEAGGADEPAYQAVRECETKGDQLTRDLLTRLETTFVTPFDREDIHSLTEELDDVVDEMHDVSALMFLLPHADPPQELLAQCDVMVRIGETAVDLISRLDGLGGIGGPLGAINDLESEGDRAYRSALARLFDGSYEAMDVLRWKDIVEGVERAIDHVENIGDVVETIAVKYA